VCASSRALGAAGGPVAGRDPAAVGLGRGVECGVARCGVWSVEWSEELRSGRVQVEFYTRRKTISSRSIRGI
jgi:hypothetical protein